MDKKQLDMLVCPECRGKLNYDRSSQELICDQCKLAYPVTDGIAVMLVDEARKLEASR